MDVYFADHRLKRDLTTSKLMKRRFGAVNAKLIQRRLDNLRFAPNLEAMRSLPGRIHELVADRAGTLAIDLKGGLRLVIAPADDPSPRKEDGGLDWYAIRSVVVHSVEDYHD